MFKFGDKLRLTKNTDPLASVGEIGVAIHCDTTNTKVAFEDGSVRLFDNESLDLVVGESTRKKQLVLAIKNELEPMGFVIEETGVQIYCSEALEGREYVNLYIRVDKYGSPHAFTLFIDEQYHASNLSSYQSSYSPTLAILGFLSRKIELENYQFSRN